MDISYNKVDLQYFMNPAFSSIMDKKTPIDEELKTNLKMYKKRIFLLTKEFLNDNTTQDLRLNSLFDIYASTCIEYFKFNDKINDIQQRLRRGETKKAIRQDLQESNLAISVIDSVLEEAEENNSVKFWTITSKGVVKAIPLIFKNFLEMNGFFKFCPEGQKNYVFVRVTNARLTGT